MVDTGPGNISVLEYISVPESMKVPTWNGWGTRWKDRGVNLKDLPMAKSGTI